MVSEHPRAKTNCWNPELAREIAEMAKQIVRKSFEDQRVMRRYRKLGKLHKADLIKMLVELRGTTTESEWEYLRD